MVADGLAREIHVSRGFQQHQCPALVLRFGHVAVTLGGKNSVGRLCKGVQHVETDVVTGFGVFGADIPQPNNEVFHIPGLFRSLGSSARRTGYANGADGGRSGGDELQVLELEVADEDGLAYAQFRNVHDDFVGKVLDQCADDQFVH